MKKRCENADSNMRTTLSTTWFITSVPHNQVKAYKSLEAYNQVIEGWGCDNEVYTAETKKLVVGEVSCLKSCITCKSVPCAFEVSSAKSHV